jgi:hypothetical protein
MQSTRVCWADLPHVTTVCIFVSEKVRMQQLREIEEIVEGNNKSITHSLILEMLRRRGILWDQNLFVSYQDSLYYILTALNHVKTYARAKRLASKMMFIINPLYPSFKDSSSGANESSTCHWAKEYSTHATSSHPQPSLCAYQRVVTCELRQYSLGRQKELHTCTA